MKILTAYLCKQQVPQADARISVIDSFALTFDIIGELADRVLDVDINSEPNSLSLLELRYVLYCEQRRWNHYGRAYDSETEKKIRKIIASINTKVDQSC